MRVAEVQCLNGLIYRLHSTMSIECLAWDEGKDRECFPPKSFYSGCLFLCLIYDLYKLNNSVSLAKYTKSIKACRISGASGFSSFYSAEGKKSRNGTSKAMDKRI